MFYIIDYIKNILGIITIVFPHTMPLHSRNNLDQVFLTHSHYFYPCNIVGSFGWKTLSCVYRLQSSGIIRRSHKNTYLLLIIIPQLSLLQSIEYLLYYYNVVEIQIALVLEKLKDNTWLWFVIHQAYTWTNKIHLVVR